MLLVDRKPDHSAASREFRPHGAKGSCSCAPPDAGRGSRWSARLPAWFSCPLSAAFSGSPTWGASPGIPYRRSCGFQGATGKTATKKPSQNRPALPSLFMEGHASRLCNGWKAKMFSPAGSERICKNMLYSIVGIDYHKNRAMSTRTCRGKAPPSCCARPFCRLKAPLGLSLLRCAAQTRTFENTSLSAGYKKTQ